MPFDIAHLVGEFTTDFIHDEWPCLKKGPRVLRALRRGIALGLQYTLDVAVEERVMQPPRCRQNVLSYVWHVTCGAGVLSSEFGRPGLSPASVVWMRSDAHTRFAMCSLRRPEIPIPGGC